MKQIMAILSIILIFAIPVTAANVTKFEIHGMVFDESSNKYNTTLLWDAPNFTGFWYASGGGKSSETLMIDQAASSLKTESRIINEEKLLYNTARTDQKYVVFSEKGKLVENVLEYNSTSKIFTRNTTGGYYARLGWFGDVYIAVNGNANKLAKLVKEQKKDEKQTLKLGVSWDLGEGYNLTLNALDTKTSPRQAWLLLTKDGKTLDIKVVNEDEVYTYIEKSLDGESNVPLFVTYVDGIFTGAEGMAAFVQLKYTWLISNNVLAINTGDKFGVFEVKEATETGHSSTNPATNRPYGIDFPMITIKDMVKAQKYLIDHLGIEKLLCVVGGSMGGMQALQWAASYPERVRSIIPIATTLKHSPQQIAFIVKNLTFLTYCPETFQSISWQNSILMKNPENCHGLSFSYDPGQ